jgi:hypothetical protein
VSGPSPHDETQAAAAEPAGEQEASSVPSGTQQEAPDEQDKLLLLSAAADDVVHDHEFITDDLRWAPVPQPPQQQVVLAALHNIHHHAKGASNMYMFAPLTLCMPLVPPCRRAEEAKKPYIGDMEPLDSLRAGQSHATWHLAAAQAGPPVAIACTGQSCPLCITLLEY